MKKQTGIWLDIRNAWVINLPTQPDGAVEVLHIASEVEEDSHVGGTRSKAPWGPQGGDHEHSSQERQHQDEKHYFTNILKHLSPTTEEIVIFGPSEAKFGLKNLLNNLHQTPTIMGVESADHMTEKQMIAWVRQFFGHPAPRKLPGFGQIHKD
jgi:hypothetical protein